MTNWEIKFKEKFKCKDCDKYHFPHGMIPDDIISFIQDNRQKLIHQIREETKDRILKSLPRTEDSFAEDIGVKKWNEGYNFAITDIRTIINDLDKGGANA